MPKPDLRPRGKGAAASGLRGRHSPSAAGNLMRAVVGYQPTRRARRPLRRTMGKRCFPRNNRIKSGIHRPVPIYPALMQHRKHCPQGKPRSRACQEHISLKAEDSIRAPQAGLLTEPHRVCAAFSESIQWHPARRSASQQRSCRGITPRSLFSPCRPWATAGTREFPAI